MGRRDGKRVKNVEPMYLLLPYILKYRYDSRNMITLDIPIKPPTYADAVDVAVIAPRL